MKMSIGLSFLCVAGGATSVLAGAPDFSNTLGQPGFSGSYVAAFTVWDDGSGDSLYATGSCAAVGVPGGSLIARWDGSAWNAVGGGLQNQYSNTMAVYQGDLIVGGYFDSAGNVADTAKLARFDGTSWHSMNAQSSSFLNSVWDLAVWDDGATGSQLYVAGNYLDLGGDPTLDHIAKWDGTTYSAVGGTIGGAVPLIVLDILPADLGGGSKLYAAGRFLTIGGVDAKNIAVWDGTTWAPLGGGLTRTSGTAQVFHMTAWDDGNGMAIYACGSFNLADGNPVLNIAKWNGTSWSAMGDGFDSAVQELITFDDGTGEALYAMGNFNNSGATPVARLAKWNGTSWEAVGTGADGNIYGAIVYDSGEGDSLILGGGFSTLGGVAASRVGAILAAPSCVPDFTGDGVLDFFDVLEFLGAFDAMEARADLANDGVFDFFDVAAFLQAFADGCP